MIRIFAILFLVFAGTAAHAQSFSVTDATLAGEPSGERITIVVKNGVIAAIGPGAVSPPDLPVIDAKGKPVTQPIFAAATQIGLSELGGTGGGQDNKKRRGAAGKELSIAYGFNANALTVQNARADGVGHALIYPDEDAPLIAGMAAVVEIGASGAAVRNSRVALFAIEESPSDLAGGSLAGFWSELHDQLTEAKSEKSGSAMGSVANGSLPLVLQINREADLKHAIALQREFGLRIIVYGGAEAWRVADTLAKEKIAVIVDPLDELPFYYDRIGSRTDNAKILSQAGVDVGFFVSGQGIYRSWNVGISLRLGAGIAVRNGMAYKDALAAITSSPARIWGMGGIKGLTAGAPANLVIWDGDPLEPASDVYRQFRGGVEVSGETRQTLLRDRYLRQVLPQQQP